jgi:pyruvate formate lyase activating enzyme
MAPPEPAETRGAGGPRTPSGLVFNLQRFSIHDGPGIRTTVFLKGCPLRCPWCHNPEGQGRASELLYSPERCLGCGACVRACERGGHLLAEGRHEYRRGLCAGCGACASVCPSQALSLAGRSMTVTEVMDVVRRDAPFYQRSGGGLTVSGGEPLLQPEFTSALLAAARSEGFSTAIETSGAFAHQRLLEMLPALELVLFDLKETDPARHRELVGAELAAVLDCLKAINDAGAKIILRCPIIPGQNDRPGHFEGLIGIAKSLRRLEAIEILPFHPLGRGKLARLGRPDPLPGLAAPPAAAAAEWVSALGARAPAPVRSL